MGGHLFSEMAEQIVAWIEQRAATELNVFRSGDVEASAEAAGRDEYYRTLSAIGAGYLVLEGRYDTWIEVGHSPPYLNENPLSRETFDFIRELATEAFTDPTTKDTPIEVMTAMMAIHDLGKSKNFCDIVARELPEECKHVANHDQWLDIALQHTDCSNPNGPLSRLMPLLCSLDTVWQQRIKRAFSIDLNVGQTLQGENTPRELMVVAAGDGGGEGDPHAFLMFLVHFLLDTAGVLAKDRPEPGQRFNLGLMGEGLAGAYVALIQTVRELNNGGGGGSGGGGGGNPPRAARPASPRAGSPAAAAAAAATGPGGGPGGAAAFARAQRAYGRYLLQRGQQCGFDHTQVDMVGCLGAGDRSQFVRLAAMLRMYHERSPVRAAELLGALNALAKGPRRALARELRYDVADSVVLYYAPAFMCAAAGNTSLGNMQARLVVALEVLAKMYKTARTHYAADPGNNNYMIQTISGMVGKAESTDAIKSWRFQVEVSEHGEQHIELAVQEASAESGRPLSELKRVPSVTSSRPEKEVPALVFAMPVSPRAISRKNSGIGFISSRKNSGIGFSSIFKMENEDKRDNHKEARVLAQQKGYRLRSGDKDRHVARPPSRHDPVLRLNHDVERQPILVDSYSHSNLVRLKTAFPERTVKAQAATNAADIKVSKKLQSPIRTVTQRLGGGKDRTKQMLLIWFLFLVVLLWYFFFHQQSDEDQYGEQGTSGTYVPEFCNSKGIACLVKGTALKAKETVGAAF